MRIPVLIKAVVAVGVSYSLLKFGIPWLGGQIHPGTSPVVPTALMQMYVFFLVVVVLMVFTSTEEGQKGIVGPIQSLYGNPSFRILRVLVIVVIGAGGACLTYQSVKPSFDAPVELRSIHPAPPSSLNVFKKSYDLLTLENPYREDKENFAENVKQGGIVFFKNCFFCHGDFLDGKGFFADGFFPVPANFQDVGTIAQLQESYLFWRISTGGPGLPKEATPWLSAMPIWQHLITEEQAWKAILFLYDYTGHAPRVMG